MSHNTPGGTSTHEVVGGAREVRKYVARAVIAEAFARSPVEFDSNRSRIILRHMSHGRALGKELPYQPVEIFVCTALLRTVGVGEIHLALQALLNRFVLRKFPSVVARDGVYRQILERLRHDMGDDE